MALSEARDKIRSLRVRNFEERPEWFVPNGALESCLTRETITSILRSCDLKQWSISELCDLVADGARKVLSVLVLIGEHTSITAFIENDRRLHYQRLDSQIPFRMEALKEMIPHCADEFFAKQWELAAPMFSQRLSRTRFDPNTTLPFLQREHIGKGGFGNVWKIVIPPGHHDFEAVDPETNAEFALKELETQSPRDANTAMNQEHEVLANLHHLRHPNLIPLLSFYTHRAKLYLLFPLAKGGDLDKIIRSPSWPAEFAQHHAVYGALAGLASGLQALHMYRSTSCGLSMIGYHHDIKPKNVLVNHDAFVLADFGLAKLKESDDSKTTLAAGLGWYAAPEVETYYANLENRVEFRKGIIGRASDIWSFGCVLLEVLVYMALGADGVNRFRQSRTYRVAAYGTKTFFKGAAINPAVTDILEELDENDNPSMKGAVSLARRILVMGPERRLKAQQIAAWLRFLFLNSSFQRAHRDCSQLPDVHEPRDWDVKVEWVKFEQWANVLQLGHDGLGYESLQDNVKAVFGEEGPTKAMIGELNDLGCNAHEGPTTDDVVKLALVYRLQSANDALCRALPQCVQDSIQQRVEVQVLAECSDLDLEQIGHLFQTKPNTYDLGVRAAIRRMYDMTESAERSPDESVVINGILLRDREPFQSCIRAQYLRGRDAANVPVLIEWIVYAQHWAGAEVGTTMFNRIGALVRFLSCLQTQSSSASSRILPCLGYFHEAANSRFGLVYELQNSAVSLVSLHEIIADTADQRHRPSLEEIYKFCFELSAALLEFHKFNWLHKNVSSFQILIQRFANPQKKEGRRVSLADFKVIGFNSSRPSHPDEYTEGAWTKSDEQRKYQHPEYLQHAKRYRARYDYYSLGLVLAEMGMWKTLKGMRVPDDDQGTGNPGSRSKSRGFLVKSVIPSLPHRMGTKFRDVVEACLTEEPWQSSDEGATTMDSALRDARSMLVFEKTVVRTLQELAQRAQRAQY
ncbi:kinase-like domain-containing protein [Chaetomium sp. MPI-CAGE-AT-0009]|nr:kinase-like domain-containing protein [Chaetomium sp. MPI-CAGE-AT-0009]